MKCEYFVKEWGIFSSSPRRRGPSVLWLNATGFPPARERQMPRQISAFQFVIRPRRPAKTIIRICDSEFSEEPVMPKMFSPSDSALVLIDHQFGTMQLIKNLPLEAVKRNTLALARAAQILHIPAVLTSSQ